MTKTEAYQDSLQFLGLTKKNGVGVGELYALKPTNNGGNFVWSRALSAYRTNQEGLLELVASGVPRVDYSNTCPELLIEKQSTNLVQRSQEFDNAYWTKGSSTIVANSIIAPDGTTTADTWVEANGVGITPEIVRAVALSNTTEYTWSIYAKPNGRDWIVVNANDGSASYRTWFNITTGVVGTNPVGSTAKISLQANGFYRCSVTRTTASSAAGSLYDLQIANADGVNTYTGNGVNGVYIWGVQLEQSSYATSYIPTTNATVTRPQDKAYNTTIAYGLKGTIFIRARIFSSTYTKVDTLFSLNDETLDDYITCSTNASRSIFITTMGGAIDTNSYNYSLASNGIYSIAIGYDFTGVNNKVNIAINGVLKRANAAQVDNPPVALSRFDLGSLYETLPSVDNRIIGQMYFADQLSDTDLTALTVQ
jgi:hypothetical protein